LLGSTQTHRDLTCLDAWIRFTLHRWCRW